MAVTLQVGHVRAEIYKSAGGPQSAGTGAASTALLGRIFHEAFAELVGADERKNYHAALDEAESGFDEWRTALINHAYQRLIGPRLRRHQAELNLSPEQVLNFWDAAQELCAWLAELFWKANERGAQPQAALVNAEQPLRWELRDEGWTDAVVLTGIADAVCRVPEKSDWCLIELKTGRTAPEADLAQACLYHQMLAASGIKANGALALVSFQPHKHEQLFTADKLADAQQRLRALIGRLAGVLPNAQPQVAPPFATQPAQHSALGRNLERAFAEYNAEIKANAPVVGPTFLRFPIELGKRVMVKALRQRVEEVQVRLNLDAPPRVSNEGGRLAIDLQRPDRQIVLFSQIRNQLPASDEKFGNAQAPVGVDLSGKLRLADFSQPDNAHLLVAGTPGSGKSEWLRTAVAGLLLTNTPDTLRLAVADPKRNAFQLLRQSPYLYRDIAYDEDSALTLLEQLVEEMETRYGQMAQVNADKLADFIRITGEQTPRVFFICDEYADLMMGERKKRQGLEGSIRRLGQKARAAGIHLILATQQPSRQVTSGPILAVITAKVALRMQEIESRILLGEGGAETLLGKGDLLYKCIGDPMRLQAPYLATNELEEVFGSRAKQGSNI
jgi:DNA segregation ATPase FtsK/SpoIIIE, S-DNA-T family